MGYPEKIPDGNYPFNPPSQPQNPDPEKIPSNNYPPITQSPPMNPYPEKIPDGNYPFNPPSQPQNPYPEKISSNDYLPYPPSPPKNPYPEKKPNGAQTTVKPSVIHIVEAHSSTCNYGSDMDVIKKNPLCAYKKVVTKNDKVHKTDAESKFPPNQSTNTNEIDKGLSTVINGDGTVKKTQKGNGNKHQIIIRNPKKRNGEKIQITIINSRAKPVPLTRANVGRHTEDYGVGTTAQESIMKTWRRKVEGADIPEENNATNTRTPEDMLQALRSPAETMIPKEKEGNPRFSRVSGFKQQSWKNTAADKSVSQ